MDADRFNEIVNSLPVRVAGDSTKLASVLGVTAWTVNNYTNGKTIPAPVERLMEALAWAVDNGCLDSILIAMGVEL